MEWGVGQPMESTAAQSTVLAGMPVGRRTPRGKRRWYLVHAPEGQEQALCAKVRQIVPADILEDAFVMRKERWHKLDGVWALCSVPMYREYFFVVTKDVSALDKEFARLTFPIRVAKTDGRHYAPLSADAQEWYERALDEDHVLRNSVAVIVDGQLHVQEGPLVGQERRMSRVDRHRRRCLVTVAEGADGQFTECAPLDVPFKS